MKKPHEYQYPLLVYAIQDKSDETLSNIMAHIGRGLYFKFLREVVKSNARDGYSKSIMAAATNKMSKKPSEIIAGGFDWRETGNEKDAVFWSLVEKILVQYEQRKTRVHGINYFENVLSGFKLTRIDNVN